MVNQENQLIEQALAPPNLRIAWEQVLANKAAPGVDGVTLERWARNWETNLERLRSQVLSNTYRPNRPRRYQVAKKEGGVRELACLTVTDKVLQRAVLNVLDDLFEQRFLNCSHGYRPKRSVATAVQQVLTYRDIGLHWVLDADISRCFDSLDHALLYNLVDRVVHDWFVLNLTRLWLKAGRFKRHQAVGIPQGAVLSPLWCNIYLNQFDHYLVRRGFTLVRYADDFIVMAASQEEALEAWQVSGERLGHLQLKLSENKTGLANFDEGFTFLGVTFKGDTYSYDYLDQHIQVTGHKLKTLYRYPPKFY